MSRLLPHSILTACILASGWLQAGTLVVSLDGTGQYGDIQSAIDAAADGDTVLVKPGEYVVLESVTFRGKEIAVRSESGPEVTTIRMADRLSSYSTVVEFTSQEGESSVLEGFTIAGGKFWGTQQGGVTCRGSSPTLTNCTISGNAGGGVYCYKSSPTLTKCTISGNSGGGVYCSEGSSPILTSCIVWGNVGSSLVVDQSSEPIVTFSCVEMEDVWSGEGNINSDPLFCGFDWAGDVYVDAGSPAGGDGSQGRPFQDLAQALHYSLSLQSGSPCLGTGKDGSNMGADEGTCDAKGPGGGVIHAASGRYSLEGLTLAHGASIVGAGAEETVLEGSVGGLRTGARLSRVTVTGGIGPWETHNTIG